MLRNIVKELFNRAWIRSFEKKRMSDTAGKIVEALKNREPQLAITLLRQFIKKDPKNVMALAQLGACLVDVGENDEAYGIFELAYRLDDSNMEVTVNYANFLSEKQRNSKAAIALLKRAQLQIPYYPVINSTYAGIQLLIGNASSARDYSLRAWLTRFDDRRLSNGLLWNSAYIDQPESVLAAEHHFWANTTEALAYDLATTPKRETELLPANTEKTLRIGYWSPDFKNHSVRYFFRPLLEGHDRSRVELILYHDSQTSDEQTDEVKNHCDQFHRVFEKTDQKLAEFIISHKLDVLVELAGHTSHNRLWMLQGRLAKAQVSGIGYPPTTGLSTIDAKMLDPQLFSPGKEKYYSEQPMVLPESFWCFDPREEALLPENPPVVSNGYITFACVGNVGKISDAILGLWAEIMRRVPKSRLLLRAVNFVDPLAVENMTSRLCQSGISAKRFTLKGPAIGDDFFRSYDEIDIVLDTYPFNGGTTTCFSVYMGVPVSTMAGESLISRVGASVMTNAGGARWIAVSEADYVSNTIALSQDIETLKDFRKNARSRMQKTSLGNGKKFAGEFEDACRDLLKKLEAGNFPPKVDMPILPPEELIRRASTVLGNGQPAAATRIVEYCLAHYPNFAGAHILSTDKLTENGEFEAAANYLLERFSSFDENGKVAALINIVRFLLYAGNFNRASEYVRRLSVLNIMDKQDHAQLLLYRSLIESQSHDLHANRPLKTGKKIVCVVPNDDAASFNIMTEEIKLLCLNGAEHRVEFQRCAEALRVQSYDAALRDDSADIVIFLQKNLSIVNPEFFTEIADALEKYDVVGYYGALQWDRLDWRLAPFEQRFGSFISVSNEKPDHFQVEVCGFGPDKLVGKIAVIDGGLIAIKPGKTARLRFDQDLLDSDTSLEEYWAWQAGKAGLKLAVHRQLGVFKNTEIVLSRTYLIPSRMLLVERLGFDILSLERNDGSTIVCPCTSPAEGYEILGRYFTDRQSLVAECVAQD